jgi:nicotinamidase/pyrazinamidase
VNVREALLVVDLQHDFLPGGALAVTAGDAILEPIRELVNSDRFGLVIATQDWHPPGHVSFASSHPGRRPFDEISLYGHRQTLWPDHCVQGSRGARLHPGLPQEPLAAIVRKGNDPDVDSYSAFRSNWDAAGLRPSTGLAGSLRERGVEVVWLVGLARDYCVKWSAEDGAEAGFEVHVLWQLTRPVDPDSDDHVRRALVDRGVHVE